jgi:hypothetical protein
MDRQKGKKTRCGTEREKEKKRFPSHTADDGNTATARRREKRKVVMLRVNR